MIYWSSTIPGRFAETDSSGTKGLNHRIYFVLTSDFKNFSPAQVLYDQGFNVIDATIQKINGEFVMFLKDETEFPEVKKNIRVATSKELTQGYGEASEPITTHWVEGPTAIETDQGWVVYYDMYRAHRMSAIRSIDLEKWTDISDEIKFPEGTRHGTVLKVKQSVLEKLPK